MRSKLILVIYTAMLLGANLVVADDAALREGGMNKLALHDRLVDLPIAVFLNEVDSKHLLADWKGKWVVLNFWATWCAPCREEMPMLDRLQVAMPELAMLPVATGRNAVEGIQRFYEEAGLMHPPILRDPKSDFARQVGVMALPVTLILNPEGQEVARLIGNAHWDSDNAKKILSTLIAG